MQNSSSKAESADSIQPGPGSTCSLRTREVVGQRPGRSTTLANHQTAGSNQPSLSQSYLGRHKQGLRSSPPHANEATILHNEKYAYRRQGKPLFSAYQQTTASNQPSPGSDSSKNLANPSKLKNKKAHKKEKVDLGSDELTRRLQSGDAADQARVDAWMKRNSRQHRRLPEEDSDEAGNKYTRNINAYTRDDLREIAIRRREEEVRRRDAEKWANDADSWASDVGIQVQSEVGDAVPVTIALACNSADHSSDTDEERVRDMLASSKNEASLDVKGCVINEHGEVPRYGALIDFKGKIEYRVAASGDTPIEARRLGFASVLKILVNEEREQEREQEGVRKKEVPRPITSPIVDGAYQLAWSINAVSGPDFVTIEAPWPAGKLIVLGRLRATTGTSTVASIVTVHITGSSTLPAAATINNWATSSTVLTLNVDEAASSAQYAQYDTGDMQMIVATGDADYVHIQTNLPANSINGDLYFYTEDMAQPVYVIRSVGVTNSPLDPLWINTAATLDVKTSSASVTKVINSSAEPVYTSELTTITVQPSGTSIWTVTDESNAVVPGAYTQHHDLGKIFVPEGCSIITEACQWLEERKGYRVVYRLPKVRTPPSLLQSVIYSVAYEFASTVAQAVFVGENPYEFLTNIARIITLTTVTGKATLDAAAFVYTALTFFSSEDPPPFELSSGPVDPEWRGFATTVTGSLSKAVTPGIDDCNVEWSEDEQIAIVVDTSVAQNGAAHVQYQIVPQAADSDIQQVDIVNSTCPWGVTSVLVSNGSNNQSQPVWTTTYAPTPTVSAPSTNRTQDGIGMLGAGASKGDGPISLSGPELKVWHALISSITGEVKAGQAQRFEEIRLANNPYALLAVDEAQSDTGVCRDDEVPMPKGSSDKKGNEQVTKEELFKSKKKKDTVPMELVLTDEQLAARAKKNMIAAADRIAKRVAAMDSIERAKWIVGSSADPKLRWYCAKRMIPALDTVCALRQLTYDQLVMYWSPGLSEWIGVYALWAGQDSVKAMTRPMQSYGICITPEDNNQWLKTVSENHNQAMHALNGNIDCEYDVDDMAVVRSRKSLKTTMMTKTGVSDTGPLPTSRGIAAAISGQFGTNAMSTTRLYEREHMSATVIESNKDEISDQIVLPCETFVIPRYLNVPDDGIDVFTPYQTVLPYISAELQDVGGDMAQLTPMAQQYKNKVVAAAMGIGRPDTIMLGAWFIQDLTILAASDYSSGLNFYSQFLKMELLRLWLLTRVKQWSPMSNQYSISDPALIDEPDGDPSITLGSGGFDDNPLGDGEALMEDILDIPVPIFPARGAGGFGSFAVHVTLDSIPDTRKEFTTTVSLDILAGTNDKNALNKGLAIYMAGKCDYPFAFQTVTSTVLDVNGNPGYVTGIFTGSTVLIPGTIDLEMLIPVAKGQFKPTTNDAATALSSFRVTFGPYGRFANQPLEFSAVGDANYTSYNLAEYLVSWFHAVNGVPSIQAADITALEQRMLMRGAGVNDFKRAVEDAALLSWRYTRMVANARGLPNDGLVPMLYPHTVRQTFTPFGEPVRPCNNFPGGGAQTWPLDNMGIASFGVDRAYESVINLWMIGFAIAPSNKTQLAATSLSQYYDNKRWLFDSRIFARAVASATTVTRQMFGIDDTWYDQYGDIDGGFNYLSMLRESHRPTVDPEYRGYQATPMATWIKNVLTDCGLQPTLDHGCAWLADRWMPALPDSTYRTVYAAGAGVENGVVPVLVGDVWIRWILGARYIANSNGPPPGTANGCKAIGVNSINPRKSAVTNLRVAGLKNTYETRYGPSAYVKFVDEHVWDRRLMLLQHLDRNTGLTFLNADGGILSVPFTFPGGLPEVIQNPLQPSSYQGNRINRSKNLIRSTLWMPIITQDLEVIWPCVTAANQSSIAGWSTGSLSLNLPTERMRKASSATDKWTDLENKLDPELQEYSSMKSRTILRSQGSGNIGADMVKEQTGQVDLVEALVNAEAMNV